MSKKKYVIENKKLIEDFLCGNKTFTDISNLKHTAIN